MVDIIPCDIFAGGAQVLIHQANCYHTMASGIAREIRERYPEAYAADLATPKDSLEKLGTYSVAQVNAPSQPGAGIAGNPDGPADSSVPRLRYIVNLYSQYGFATGNRRTSCDAMFTGLTAIRDDSRFAGLELAVPYMIGCGLGGGNWNVVTAILKAVFSDPYAEGQAQPKLSIYKK